MQYLSMTVHPGDQMKANVAYNTSTHVATFTVTNVTTGVTQVRTSSVNAVFYDGRDAEWIGERPSHVVNNAIVPYPLQNFDAVTFTSAQAKNTNGNWIYGGNITTQRTFVMENSNRMVLADTNTWYGTNNGSTIVTYYACQ